MSLERLRFCLIAGAALSACAAEFFLLCRLRRGKRKISSGDRLLFAAPVFLVLGFLVMTGERAAYHGYAAQLERSLAEGREILAKGTAAHIRQTQNGISFELKQAEAASYSQKEDYRAVGTLLVYMDSPTAENGTIKDGQQVFLYGKGRSIESAGNPGQFDAGQYYFSLGITGTLTASAVRITDFSYHRLNQAFFLAKNRLQESYLTYLGEESAGIISSMLLGERALLSDETKALYRHGGISHILAISGLHVSLLGMAVYRLLRRTVLGRNGAIPAACACVLLYGKFVEAGTSTKRAVIMFFLLLLAAALGRTYDTLSAMSVSAVLLLFQSPGILYTASFQLSYAAAYAASVFAGLLKGQEECLPVEKAVQTAKRAAGRWVRLRLDIAAKGKEILLFGMAVQLVTLPITVFHYFEYPLYGLFLNPFVVPLMAVLLLCAFLSGIFGLFCAGPGYFFAGGTCAILWFYETACKFVSKLPFSVLLFGKPALWQIGLYFCVLAGEVMIIRRVRENGKMPRTGERREWKKKLPGAALFFLPLFLLPLPPAAFEAAFLDVGQGDGIVLREHSGTVITVDGGSSDVQGVGSSRIAPYLKANGIRVIDCALVSHADSDHISGIRELLAGMPPYSAYRAGAAGYTGEILIKSIALPLLQEPDTAYLALVESAAEKNVEVLYLAAGDSLLAGKKLLLSCLAPQEGAVFSDRNASSMVLLASYGEFDIMLTGDIGTAEEKSLLVRQELKERPIEILKAAHHGSSTSSSREFIGELRPVCSVISCGKNNRYGHPHAETISVLSEAAAKILRTDELGCITIKAGKNGCRVYCGAKEKALYRTGNRAE